MTPFITKYGNVVLSLAAAVAIIAAALAWKDTPYENAWMYILVAYAVATGAWEVFVRRKG